MAVTRNPFNTRLSWKWLVAFGILAIAISLVIGIILGVIAVHFSNAASQSTTSSGPEEDERETNALQWQANSTTVSTSITVLSTSPPIVQPDIPESSSSIPEVSVTEGTFHPVDKNPSENATAPGTVELPQLEVTSQDPLASKVNTTSFKSPIDSTPSLLPENEDTTNEQFRNKPTNGTGQTAVSWNIHVDGDEMSTMSARPPWLSNTSHSIVQSSTIHTTKLPNNQTIHGHDSPEINNATPSHTLLNADPASSSLPGESSNTTPITDLSNSTQEAHHTPTSATENPVEEEKNDPTQPTAESTSSILMSENPPSEKDEISTTFISATESTSSTTVTDSSTSDAEERQCGGAVTCRRNETFPESSDTVTLSTAFSEGSTSQDAATEVPSDTTSTMPTASTSLPSENNQSSEDTLHASTLALETGVTPNSIRHNSDEESVDMEIAEPDFPCPEAPYIKIYQGQLCNGEVDCPGGTDERNCSCRKRIHERRICDGVIDCPLMEDEIGCRGCNETQFTCEIHRRRALCLPLKQRCDGVVQCPDGKDEAGCSLLAPIDHRGETLVPKFSSGFVFRNIQNNWYPLCAPPTGIDISGLADSICSLTVGKLTRAPVLSRVDVQSANYSGKFALASTSQERPFRVVENCSTSEMLVVTCPSPQCGKKAPGNQLSAGRLTKRRRRNASHRIVGGVFSEEGSWPSIVAVLKNGNFTCGGTLIGNSWVLSAAHCFDSFHQHHYEAQVGMLRTTSFSPFEQTRIIQNIYIHPGYNRISLEDDIALLEVDSPFHLNQWAAPACLSSTEFSSANRTQCVVIGWGDTFEGGPESEELREVTIPLTRCTVETTVKSTKVLCAGYPDGQKDACQGDSGGPLMCPDPEAPGGWTLTGVVSSGIGCARPGLAGVYTRLSYYLNWINEMMENPVEPTKKPRHNCPGIICRKGAGQCLDKRFLCDSKIQCYDGEDEFECRSNITTESSTPGTLAPVTLTIPPFTIPPSVSSACSESEFMCSRDFQCVSISRRCDFVKDCIDGTDELNCTCADYLVGVGKKELICDDRVDCQDRTDELGCAYRCSTGEFIGHTQLCDGISDCPDGADETSPLSNMTCPKNVFRCLLPRQSRSNETVPFDKVCNGINECSNGADEQTCVALSRRLPIKTDSNGNPKRFTSRGYVMARLGGAWSPYCDVSWGLDNTRAICQHFGFNSTASFKKVFLETSSPCNFMLYVTCS